MRLLEGLLFLSLAGGLHLGVWSLSPAATGSDAAGGTGAASVTTMAATAAETALVALWDQPPATANVAPVMVLEHPTGLDTPAMPSAAPQSNPKPLAPPVLARPDDAPTVPQVHPDPPPPPPAASVPDLRPKARPATVEMAQNTQPQSARRAAGLGEDKIRGAGGKDKTQSQDAARTNALRAQWGAAIYAKVQRNLTAPRGSRAEGTAKLALTVAANGNLQGLTLTRSSGDDLLDRAAVQAIKRAGRFSKAPKGLDGDSHDFSLSLTFTR